MSTSTIDHAHGHEHDHAHDHDHAHEHPSGLKRWLFATNHKDIGTLYLWFSFVMLLSGGVLALMIRSELFKPGLQFFQPEFFNQLTTMHGLVMVFGAIMPAFVGFANWMIPLQVGASDMAFARMNYFSFWLLFFAGLLLVALSRVLFPTAAPPSAALRDPRMGVGLFIESAATAAAPSPAVAARGPHHSRHHSRHPDARPLAINRHRHHHHH